jgi:hypothetical protein
MARVLVIGDSQAQGTPGLYAERKFKAAGHTVQRVAQPSCGAIDWSTNDVHPGCNTAGLWSRYTGAVASFRPDVIVLIYGSNDFGSGLQAGLTRMKNGVAPPVWMSGPPLYPEADRQRMGEQIRDANRAVFGARWIDAYPFTPLSLPRDSLQAHLPGESGRPWGEGIADAVMRGMSAPGVAAPLPFRVAGRSVTYAEAGVGLLGVAAGAMLLSLLLRGRR